MSSNFAFRYLKMTPEHDASAVKPAAVTYGVASSTYPDTFGEIDDESIQYMFDLMTRADVSRYGAAKSVNGKEYSEGGINFVMQPDDLLGLCFFGIYGDNPEGTSAGYAQGGFLHSFKEAKDQILPSFTLEVGREEKEHTYKGMCVQSLSINATHGEYATIGVNFTGKSESSVSSLEASPTFVGASVDGFHFANGTVRFSPDGVSSSVATIIQSISLEYNMNLDTDAACSIGSRTYIRKPEPQMREITGTVEFSTANTSNGDTNLPDYETALGTGGALYNANSAEPAIKLSFTNGTQTLDIKVRKVRWEAPTANISGRDTQTLSMNFVALVDTATGDDVMTEAILQLNADVSALGTGEKYSTK